MATNGCVNGTLEGDNYSSPVPVIGLYIAGGTLVCMLFMLFDVVSGVRHKQCWLPCRLFSLNSITLTLISVATKITVDLSMPMPGIHDQLSKLTGTVLVCIFMGFICPSIANNSNSERISNMASLTIFVITVVVNICIQIGTGVIHVFIPEHIIIMVCMFLILLLLWFCVYDVKRKVEKSGPTFDYAVASSSNGSMLERLKASYESALDGDPQAVACSEQNHSTIAGFCLICFTVLTQAGFRCFYVKKLKFCGGNSDYDWSMWIIVATQILTIALGCFATTFRWCALFLHVPFDLIFKAYMGSKYIHLIRSRSYLGTPWFKVGIYLRATGGYLTYIARTVIMFPSKILLLFYYFGGSKQEPYNWRRHKAQDNINRWTDQARERKPLKHLSIILSRTPRVKHLLTKDSTISNTQKNQVFEILDLIDTKVRSESEEKILDSKLAKAAFVGDGFRSYLSRINKGQEYQSLSLLGRAFCHLQKLDGDEELNRITRFLQKGEYGSVHDLCKRIEQIYVDMLHLYFAQLPNAILKDLSESPVQERQMRARRALKILLNVRHLEDQVKWLFPKEYNITGLISPRRQLSASRNDTSVKQDNPNASASSSLGIDVPIDVK